MSQSITIHFDLQAGGQPEFRNIHRFRNYAEEMSLSPERSELGSLPMDEADPATTHVRIRITKIRRRNVRRCMSLINELLEKHYMTDEADIRVGEGAD